MPGTFHGISMMSGALSAFQRGIDVTGNNIANVNTSGYSRQRVNYQALNEMSFFHNGLQKLGSGVTIESITRARDGFVDRNASRNFSDLGRLSSYAQGLNNIDGIYGEPSDSGISSAMGKLFDAFSNLGANPGQAANRAAVRQAAMTLADRIRGASQDLTNLSVQAQEGGAQTVERINALANQIADLNGQIASVGPTGSPNQLLDLRQSAMDELSSLVQVESTQQANGTITITVAGSILVDQSSATALNPVYDPQSGSYDPARAQELRGGVLLGQLQTIAAAKSGKGRLDDLANGLRDQINSLHTAGVTLSGATGIALFDPAGVGANGLRVSSDVLASADNIAAGASGQAGDGGLAQEIADLRNRHVTSLGDVTFSSFFLNSVTSNATEAQTVTAQLDTETAVGQQIDAQRQAVSGVSLDEEFAEMVKLQRSYQAAARALSVFDSITEDLLGIIR